MDSQSESKFVRYIEELKAAVCCNPADTVAIDELLGSFISEHCKSFDFAHIKKVPKVDFVECVLRVLKMKLGCEISTKSLVSLRILSRQKFNMESITQESTLDVLCCIAGLVDTKDPEDAQPINYDVVLEAQKCVYNLVFQSEKVRSVFSEMCLPAILGRTKETCLDEVPYIIRLFDMKLLFLVSVHVKKCRMVLRNDLCALPILTDYVVSELKRCLPINGLVDSTSLYASGPQVIDADTVGLICEILKCLYNITININDNAQPPPDEMTESHLEQLVALLVSLIMSRCDDGEKTAELVCHSVNLFTNIPTSMSGVLLIPVIADTASPSSSYMGHDTAAVHAILSFVIAKIAKQQFETLSPVLHFLTETARHHRLVRKYLKAKILPPLHVDDLKKLPEEGHAYRNELVKLMTSTSTHLKELAADLLYVLCKNNVNRLVKYTGFGNAAGFLATRGLMKGNHNANGESYSSEDSDSDSEDYILSKDGINAVTGRLEGPHPKPCEGMTMEEKEEEAEKLAMTIQKMSRSGLITPMAIGENGRPVGIFDCGSAGGFTSIAQRPSSGDSPREEPTPRQ